MTIIKKITIVVVSQFIFTIFALIILEMVLAKKPISPYGYWTISGIFQPDNELIYSLKPDTNRNFTRDEFVEIAHINSKGFRGNNEKKDSSAEQVLEIYAVGDSFTFGHGISDDSKTYPELLEKYLNDSSDKVKRKITVINAGVPGYSPDQEYRLILTKVIPLKPNLVIWNLTNSGDLSDLTLAPTWPIPALYDIKDGKLVSLDARFNWLYIANQIRLNTPVSIHDSYLFNLLVNYSSKLKFFNRRPNLSDKKLLDWATNKILLEVEDINQKALKNNFKLLIVILPYKDAFKPSELSLQFDKLIPRFREKNIDYIDIKEYVNRKSNQPADSFKVLGTQVMNPLSLYFKKDQHPNELGADLFARIVKESVNTLK